MTKKIEIFFSYAREDEELRLKLDRQLSSLKTQGLINVWHDQNIRPGIDWREEIDRHLNISHIVLLLVSPDFIASDAHLNGEVRRAMERHVNGEARVIPILLRPVDWQGTPFGSLQALPVNALPITIWNNLDEALFTVVKDIKRVIGELIVSSQSRSIALFGYEMQNSRTTPRSIDASTFLLDGTFESWFSTKRDFSNEDLIGQAWIKTSNPEHTFVVNFLAGGAFQEYALSDPQNTWQGSWELVDGVLRLKVNIYELDIFASQSSSAHIGIEFARGSNSPHSYFSCFPLTSAPAKHWHINEVSELLERLFDQILHQRLDAQMRITYGALLCRGEMSVRTITKILALSRRYKERFVNLKKPEETIERLSIAFSGQGTDTNRKHLQSKELQIRGSNAIIADLLDSEDYREDTFPLEKRLF